MEICFFPDTISPLCARVSPPEERVRCDVTGSGRAIALVVQNRGCTGGVSAAMGVRRFFWCSNNPEIRITKIHIS